MEFLGCCVHDTRLLYPSPENCGDAARCKLVQIKIETMAELSSPAKTAHTVKDNLPC
jgi:hypothetical protein